MSGLHENVATSLIPFVLTDILFDVPGNCPPTARKREKKNKQQKQTKKHKKQKKQKTHQANKNTNK